jgi:cell division protease FtsH
MVAYAGMSDRLPNLCYYNNEEYAFSKPYSDSTAELIDEEVKAIIAEQYERAKRMLEEYREGHNELAQLLMDKEVIFAEDVERIFGPRPWVSRSEEIMGDENVTEGNPSSSVETPSSAVETPSVEASSAEASSAEASSGEVKDEAPAEN